MEPVLKQMTVAGACALLAACGGGGGGGGGGGSGTPAAFYSSLLSLPTATPLTTTSTAAINEFTGQPVTVNPQVTTSTLPNGDLNQLRVVIPELAIDMTFTGADFSAEALRTGSPQQIAYALQSTGTRTLFVGYTIANAATMQYQALGAWTVTDAGLFASGITSVGFPTNVGDIPTTGTASYSGLMTGFARAGGVEYGIDALASASADFANRTVNLTTSGSFADNNITGVRAADNRFDIVNGALSYAAGTNAIRGTVTTRDGLSGPASASFYGPQAAELGGTLQVGSGTDLMVGGFGLKKN